MNRLVALALILLAAVPVLAQDKPPAKAPTVVMTLEKGGQVTLELFPADAPRHVENFVTLVRAGFYDGQRFHRVVSGFVVQLGDPQSKTLPMDHSAMGTGGPGYTIKAEFNNRKFERGITFEAPRRSLRTALDLEIFDDLLIGNFMKTTLHGRWPESRLYPDFTPYVAKYADNGRARRSQELRAYFAEYRRRTGAFAFLRHRFAAPAADVVRSSLQVDSAAYRLARRAYWMLRSQT